MDGYNKACLAIAGLGFASILGGSALTADTPNVSVEQDITPPAIERTLEQVLPDAMYNLNVGPALDYVKAPME
ncbi:MAG: hypothetical protein GY861_16210 [bacterium]|nr:hypothetical protein [bacterium]